ncbi:MAG TPA: hypothetical protein VGR22_08755 [Thermomicrobiales bacterium]|nr:hypothetical protein [Thermomicrobiales bacterium]
MLEQLHQAKAARNAKLRTLAVGADLIPRSDRNDPHLINVDPWELVSRAMNAEVRATGLARLSVTVERLPEALRARAEEIGIELARAGMLEIGRWATDVQLAYVRVDGISEEVQAAMFHAWGVAIEHLSEGDLPA